MRIFYTFLGCFLWISDFASNFSFSIRLNVYYAQMWVFRLTKIECRIKFIFDESFFYVNEFHGNSINHENGCRKNFMQNDSNRFFFILMVFFLQCTQARKLMPPTHGKCECEFVFKWDFFTHWTLLSSIYWYLCTVYIDINMYKVYIFLQKIENEFCLESTANTEPLSIQPRYGRIWFKNVREFDSVWYKFCYELQHFLLNAQTERHILMSNLYISPTSILSWICKDFC